MLIPLVIGNAKFLIALLSLVVLKMWCMHHCSDKTALTQGFVEATAIYLPTLPSLRNRNSNNGLQIQDTRNDTTKGGGDIVRTELMQYGQTDKTSDISSSTSGGEKEDPTKLTEAQKEAMSFQRLQLRKQLCYVGHGNVGDSGNSIWSGMTTMDVWTSLGSRLRPHVFTGHPRRNNNMDVHAVEVLLSRSMQGEVTTHTYCRSLGC
jgi:hypothetical protein